MRDQFNDSFKRDKRLCSPIDGNEGKELMLDCIPFAGRRRVMGHRNGQVFLVGQLLQLFLPQTISRSVGTAAIWSHQQMLLVRIELGADEVPPSSNTLHGKLCRFMIDAHIDKAALVDQIVDWQSYIIRWLSRVPPFAVAQQVS